MEEIVLTQVQIKTVAHVVGKAPVGCFNVLYQDIKRHLIYGKLPQNDNTFFDFCKKYCIGHDASFNPISAKLTITTMSLGILNDMLKMAGYGQIEDEEDEDDSGLNFNIL